MKYMCYDHGLIGKGVCPLPQVVGSIPARAYFIHFISLSNLVTKKVVYWTQKVVI